MDEVAEANAARDEALERVEANANEQWKKEAEWSLYFVAAMFPEFTSDEIWEDLRARGISEPHEPRALGAIVTKALRDGEIVNVGYRKSRIPIRHRRPVAVYKRVDR